MKARSQLRYWALGGSLFVLAALGVRAAYLWSEVIRHTPGAAYCGTTLMRTSHELRYTESILVPVLVLASCAFVFCYRNLPQPIRLACISMLAFGCGLAIMPLLAG